MLELLVGVLVIKQDFFGELRVWECECVVV